MNMLFQSVKCTSFRPNSVKVSEEAVIFEKPVSLFVNGEQWLTFMCTPSNLEELAIGFLFNEDLISNKSQIANVYVCKNKDIVDVWLYHSVEEPRSWKRTSGCTGGYTSLEHTNKPSESQKIPFRLSTKTIQELIHKFNKSQNLYKVTGGVHSSAISDGKEILKAMEDIGRHNTLDKLAGYYILEQINSYPPVILSTGRISSEMLQKAAHLGAQILISRTSATSLSVEMAESLGITLIGYARGNRLTVYSHPERIIV
jgi:FdhD protein